MALKHGDGSFNNELERTDAFVGGYTDRGNSEPYNR